METALNTLKKIRNSEYFDELTSVYGNNKTIILEQQRRYASAIQAFSDLYRQCKGVHIYSTPGRTEIIGNHTDHNGGCGIAAAVNADIIAVVSKNDDNVIRVRSKGYDKTIVIDLNEMYIHENEIGRSPSLIRGVAAAFIENGGKVSGFDAYTTSTILKGSGLSSSAAFEVCIATIINAEFNNDKFSTLQLAQFSKWAENVYYQKQSGLLDQIASAFGGALYVDLYNEEKPIIKKIDLDFIDNEYAMLITDTAGTHGNQIKEVSEICMEMQKVAQHFGKEKLAYLDKKIFYKSIKELRHIFGDKAILRCIHFYEECARVQLSYKAVKSKSSNEFLSLLAESGDSSFEFNQNAYNIHKPHIQGVSLGVAISKKVLKNNKGIVRLQGSGFAGTILAFVLKDNKNQYKNQLQQVFCKNCCKEFKIRKLGTTRVL